MHVEVADMDATYGAYVAVETKTSNNANNATSTSNSNSKSKSNRNPPTLLASSGWWQSKLPYNILPYGLYINMLQHVIYLSPFSIHFPS